LLLVGEQVVVEGVADEVAEDGVELFDVLDAVGALPLGRLPLLAGDAAPAGEPGPVGLDEFPALVRVWLHGDSFGYSRCRQLAVENIRPLD
jgi:hypothetical protein